MPDIRLVNGFQKVVICIDNQKTHKGNQVNRIWRLKHRSLKAEAINYIEKRHCKYVMDHSPKE
jgi:hypothetical protein